MKFITLAVIVLALSITASEQYSTPVFSATFGCSVKVNSPDPQHDKDGKTVIGTSTGYWCGSSNPGLTLETINVTKFNRGIAVDFSYSESYQKDMNEDDDLLDVSNGYYQGHPFTYVKAEFTGDGQRRWRRSKLIVVDSRTTIWIMMDAPVELSSDKNWENFANGLVIK